MPRLVVEAVTKVFPKNLRICFSVSDSESGKPILGVTHDQVQITVVSQATGEGFNPVFQGGGAALEGKGFYVLSFTNGAAPPHPPFPHGTSVVGIIVTTETGHGQTIVDVVSP